MGKLRKLRTRFVSSIDAVKRSVLRRQSQTSTSASNNPTTLTTRLASVDSAIPARTDRPRGRRAQKQQQARLMQSQDPDDEENAGEQLQLHWNEARRIYSEPMQTIQHITSTASEDKTPSNANAGTAAIDARSQQCCTATSDRKIASIGSLCASEQGALGGTDEEEDYDDVFLQSWEEPGLCVDLHLIMMTSSLQHRLSEERKAPDCLSWSRSRVRCIIRLQHHFQWKPAQPCSLSPSSLWRRRAFWAGAERGGNIWLGWLENFRKRGIAWCRHLFNWERDHLQACFAVHS